MERAEKDKGEEEDCGRRSWCDAGRGVVGIVRMIRGGYLYILVLCALFFLFF